MALFDPFLGPPGGAQKGPKMAILAQIGWGLAKGPRGPLFGAPQGIHRELSVYRVVRDTTLAPSQAK